MPGFDNGYGAGGADSAPPPDMDERPMHGPDDAPPMDEGGEGGKSCGYLNPDFPGEVGDVLTVRIVGMTPEGEKEIEPADGAGKEPEQKKGGWRDDFDKEVVGGVAAR